MKNYVSVSLCSVYMLPLNPPHYVQEEHNIHE